MTFDVIHKPTFQNQLRALPKERRLQVLDKIDILQDDPSPHEPLKKLLHGYKDRVYRLRSGDFRVFYTYGNGWVTLLGVSDRKDAYRGDQIAAEGPGFDLDEVPKGDWTPELERQHTNGRPDSPPPVREEFARPIDDALLERLRIPEGERASLRGRRTLEELANAPVPEANKVLVLDAVVDPDYNQVLQQPDLITGDPSDLLKFAEGELLGFLLRLDPDQERFVDWALEGAGPTLVKGGPGTGKSTIALYRVRSILNLLRNRGVLSPRILFTTYTSALTAASEQLLKRLLGDDAGLVEVRTADSVAWGIVAEHDGKPRLVESKDLRGLLKDAMAGVQIEGSALVRRKQLATLEKLSQDYILEEITAVIEARALNSLGEYLAAPRAGRRVRLTEVQRGAIWRVYEAFDRLLKRRGVWTWSRIRRRAAELVQDGQVARRYDAVVIDEAQDLDATVLRVLVGLSAAPDRIFVTADANQSIYGSGFRWTDVHADLRFQGRTGVLRKNYRTTREIGEAAQAYLQGGALDDEAIERTYAQSDGPLPVVRTARGAAAEIDLLVRFLRVAARDARQGLGACAVLVPSEMAGRALADGLTAAGVPAEFMPGRELDLEKSVVKVITLQSAKGLEFPVVAVAGFIDGLPPAGGRGAGEDETEEVLARQRRLLFVAITRAMRSLLVVTPDRPWPLFTGFDPQLWNTGAPAPAPGR
jgi:superfamily I DNA/RNA helicase/mRNA-degrading endonuclease RelE of RelBE toxin-antitoxin system